MLATGVADKARGTTLISPPGSARPYSTEVGPLTTSTESTFAMLIGTPFILMPLT